MLGFVFYIAILTDQEIIRQCRYQIADYFK